MDTLCHIVCLSISCYLHFSFVRHLTPTSPECLQLWTPHPWCRHWFSLISCPVHSTLSIQIWPVPSGTSKICTSVVVPLIPSCLHTTAAALSSKRSQHTVPHSLLWNISKRPVFPSPTILTLPSIRSSVQQQNNT